MHGISCAGRGVAVPLLLTLSALVLLGPAAAQSASNVTLNGTTYVITTVNTTTLALAADGLYLDTAWGSDPVGRGYTLAMAVCTSLGTSLGTPNWNGTTGPLFIWLYEPVSSLEGDTGSRFYAYWWNGGSCQFYGPSGNTTEPLVIAYQRFPSATIDINGTNVAANATISAAVNVTDCPNPPCTSSWLLECPGADNITFPGSPVSITTGGPGSDIPASYVSSTICTLTLTVADALGSAYTEAVSLEVQPAASPPPDCSLAVFTPPMLASRTVGQVCAANKEARRGQIPRLATNVVLSLTSAQGQNATINITDIVFNKATAGWQCRCRPTKRDNCTCIPNAMLLGGGSFRVMPQWRRATRPGSIADTVFQVSFTATTSGGTSECSAVICSAWGVQANKPPPTCLPFNSTGASRPALTCV